MDVGYNSWYSTPTKSPTFQQQQQQQQQQTYPLTPNLKKTQMYENDNTSTPRTRHSPGTVKFSSPLSSTYMNGEINSSFRNQSSSFNDKLDTNNNSESGSFSPASKLAQMDITAAKQLTKEVQFLMNEIKEKDAELNEIVHSHHKQLLSWQHDRERMTSAENKLGKLKSEYKKRREQCSVLTENLKRYEDKDYSKDREILQLRKQLQEQKNQWSSTKDCIDELKQKNETLQFSIEELSANLGELRALKQQHETLLRLRENDLKDAKNKNEELEEKLKAKSISLNEQRKYENEAKEELSKCRQDKELLKNEMEELKTSYNESLEQAGQEEISLLKDEIIILQKESMLFGEREQRKESLLELAKSKQERTEIELSNLRLLYNSLQDDMVARKQKEWRENDSFKFSLLSDVGDDDDESAFLNSSLIETSNVLKAMSEKAAKDCAPLTHNSSYLQVFNVQNGENGDFYGADVKNIDGGDMKLSELDDDAKINTAPRISQKVADDLEKLLSTNFNENESQNTSFIDGNTTDSVIFGEKEHDQEVMKNSSFH